MELDELKATWKSLDRSLTQHNQINLHLLREGKLDKTRRSLHPLAWAQIAQMLFGLAFILLAAMLWYRAGSVPLSLPLSTLVAGIFMHVYGVATLALAGCTLGMINSIDYSAPVLDIQKQLARLRRFYIFNGMIVGLPWWFLWVPLLMVLTGLGGVELYAKAPSVVWTGMVLGIIGLLATWWFHRWSRNPKRPRLAKSMEDSVTGGSLRKAQNILDEITRFEQE